MTVGSSRNAGRHELDTERVRSELAELDLLSVEELVALMCDDVHRVPEAVQEARPAITEAVHGVVERLGRGGRLIYVGAGTAGRLGLLDAAEAGPTFNAPAGQVIAVLAGGRDAVEVPVENAEDDPDGGAQAMAALEVGPDDAVVGITASGRTPFVLGAVEAAGRAGSLTVGLMCNQASPLAALAEIAVELPVGPEIVAGSTRLNAGTAQKIVLNIVSTAAMIHLGKTYGGLMVDLRATNTKLRNRATRIVGEIAGVDGEQAREALEACGWSPKLAAAMLLGAPDPAAAEALLDRHAGRLRSALDELAAGRRAAPGPGPDTRRLGVSAAFVGGTVVRGDVGVSGDRVVAVGLAGAGSGIAIPALVDAQVNGYAGVDLLTAETEALETMSYALLRDGVAAYQATLISSPETHTIAALQRIAEAQRRGTGATIVGVHLEGPFLAPSRAGAHPVEHLRTPDPALLLRLLSAGPVKTVTLAPELPGAHELIELCVTRGVAVWLGHSDATAADARSAFKAGAVAVAHLFNAMGPISSREPGLAGVALATPEVTIQLIADGVHVSDELLRVAFEAAPGRCNLISDAIAATGLGDGTYRLGAVGVEVTNGISRRDDGVLAGATARLADGLVRLGELGIGVADAVAAVTENPRRLLGGEFGRLELGGRADVLVVDDRLAIRQVLNHGREPVAARR
jgi:N-acetylmuramic acid 6-phosphate etherase/N-acetylglucosamine-6-phosphate deacetylase